MNIQAKAKGRTIDDFRSAHDPNVIIPAKIKRALAAMEAEGFENWEYESDFVKRAAISQTQLGQFRESFISHVVETASAAGRSARKVWFASAKVAAKVREG